MLFGNGLLGSWLRQMSGSECSGRFVGLFDPDECAPGSKALAGNSLGYRGRAACKCEPESGLTTIELMKEDFRVSALGLPDPDEGLSERKRKLSRSSRLECVRHRPQTAVRLPA